MRHAHWFGLFVLCSLLAACKSGPKVTLCIIDPEIPGLVCVDPEENATIHELSCQRPEGVLGIGGLEEFKSFVCVSPRDFETLLNACKRGHRT